MRNTLGMLTCLTLRALELFYVTARVSAVAGEEAWLFGWGPQWAPEGQPNKPKQTEISGRGGAICGHNQQANGSKKCN
mgnify:FL=1